MNLIPLLLFLPFANSQVLDDFLPILANVTLLLYGQRSNDCIQIFRPDSPNDSEWRRLLNLWRILALEEAKTTTGIYSFGEYIKRKRKNPWKRSCYKPTKVIFGDASSKEGFIALSKEIRIKDSLWIFFMDSEPEEFFGEANVLFDSEFIIARINSKDLISLYEIFKVRKDYPLRIRYYGNWTREGGLAVPNVSLYDRRFDLEGLSFRAGCIKNWPMTYMKGSKWVGFLPSVWSEIEEITNSSASFYPSLDGVTGLIGEDGTWNGLVGMIIRGEIDIMISEITLEKSRSHVLDLFYPLIYTNYQLYFKQLGYHLQWNSIFKPFDESIWITLLIWVMLGTVIITILYHVSLTFGLENDREEVYTLVGSFFFILQTLSQQGHDTVPRSAACRILFFLAYLVSAVLIPSYSASLISYLTLEVPYRPFNSLEEMHADGKYRLLIKENTAEYAYFMLAKNRLLLDIYKKQVETVPVEHRIIDTRHAFEVLCNHSNYAYFGVEIIMNVRLGTTIKPTCPVLVTTNPVSSVYLTMGLLKDSPYTGVMNHILLKMLGAGITKRIQIREIPYFYTEPSPPQRQVSIEEVFQMFVFVGFFALTSVFILFMEKKFYRYKYEKRKNVKVLHWFKTKYTKNYDLPLVIHKYDSFIN